MSKSEQLKDAIAYEQVPSVVNGNSSLKYNQGVYDANVPQSPKVLPPTKKIK